MRKEILRYAQDKIRPYPPPLPCLAAAISKVVGDGLILFLVGPTAVGKTEVSLQLARLINAEIISCDSMQVYKGMDIGTQKPTPSQQKTVPHHMIDIINPTRNFSVAGFRRRALDYINKIHRKGKIPLFVGGTALYMKALIDGLFPSPPADRRLRKKLFQQEKLNQKGFLYKQLLKVDPRTAKKFHPNDTRRIIRALEVYIKTDTPMSELKKMTKGLTDRYNVKVFALNRNRQDLYERVERRVDRMFRQGFIEECRRLINPSPLPFLPPHLLGGARPALSASCSTQFRKGGARKLGRTYLPASHLGGLAKRRSLFVAPAMCDRSLLKGRGGKGKRLSLTAQQALGYKEVFAHLNGEIPLKELKGLIKKNTRHFAKRQLSWFRNDKRVIWIDVDEKTPKETAEVIYTRCMK